MRKPAAGQQWQVGGSFGARAGRGPAAGMDIELDGSIRELSLVRTVPGRQTHCTSRRRRREIRAQAGTAGLHNFPSTRTHASSASVAARKTSPKLHRKFLKVSVLRAFFGCCLLWIPSITPTILPRYPTPNSETPCGFFIEVIFTPSSQSA
ncbi:hypothetical protein B0T20DRAFT_267261 [Sordaria brevicollis]|uniref:Uncharacterized protein n=1 Tax=Sordaria brevicollis TaxID=83679 RepID=A0AAE0PAI7_SORBR|nr:hypothetical protein B0T20DRAFT_267261 [Sordaria brevicollis]